MIDAPAPHAGAEAQRSRRATWLDVLLIALPWALYVVAMASTNLIVDTARDIAQAHLIATGADWPLRGPMIGGAVYLGPLWFYLLAPAAVTGSTLVVAGWAGLLGGSKFLFGWLLGSALAGRAAGRGLVVALSLPAWPGFELIVYSHTNLIVASGLAFAWACLRLARKPTNGRLAVVAVLAVVMLHAHPSMVVWLVLAVPGLCRGLRSTIRIRTLASVGALCALPFIAPLFAPADQSRVLGAATLIPSGDVLARSPLVMLALARSVVWDGPLAIISIVADWSTPAAAMLTSVALAVIGAGLLGLAQARRTGVVGGALLLFFLGLAFAAILRPITPLYMVYGASSALAIALGVGLGQALARDRGLVALVLALALLGTQVIAVGALASSGSMRIEASVVNVSLRPSPKDQDPGSEHLSALSADRLGRVLCAQPGRIHGPLATSLDLAYAIPIRMRCGLGLGELARIGDQTGRRWLGLPAVAWQAVARQPTVNLGQWGLALGVDVLKRGDIAFAEYRSARDYPPWRYHDRELETVTLEIELSPRDVLIVTSLEHLFGGNEPARLELDGVVIDSSWRSLWSSVWRPAQERPERFVLRLSGRSLDAIEVLRLRAEP